MHFTLPIGILSLAGVSVAASMGPNGNAVGLERRQDSAWGKFSFCNSCFGNSCTQTIYGHWGDGTSDCDDPATAFTNSGYCETESGTTIETPDGDGTWTVDDGCKEGGDNGIKLGTIDVGGTVHECFSNDEQYSTWCGNQFACQFTMYCN